MEEKQAVYCIRKTLQLQTTKIIRKKLERFSKSSKIRKTLQLQTTKIISKNIRKIFQKFQNKSCSPQTIKNNNICGSCILVLVFKYRDLKIMMRKKSMYYHCKKKISLVKF